MTDEFLPDLVLFRKEINRNGGFAKQLFISAINILYGLDISKQTRKQKNWRNCVKKRLIFKMAFKTLLSMRCLSNSAALMATMASRQTPLPPTTYHRKASIN